jgi:Uma2 family endonuclease
MPTVPTLPLMSVERYLNSSWRPDREFIDGVLLKRNLGTLPHAGLQEIVQAHFGALAREYGIRVFPGVRLKLSDTRYRIPDVIVVSRPVDMNARTYDGTPLIIVEVLSPEDRLNDVVRKIQGLRHLGSAT